MPTQSRLNAPEFIYALKQGQCEAWEELVQAMHARLHRFLFRKLDDSCPAPWQTAEDLLQETFKKAFVGIKQFRGEARIETWLYAIARNQAINFLQRQASPRASPRDLRAAFVDLLQDLLGPDWQRTPQKQYELEERRKRVEAVIAALPPADRELIRLRYYQGLTEPQIAERFRVPLGTVSGQLARARQKLREALRDLLP